MLNTKRCVQCSSRSYVFISIYFSFACLLYQQQRKTLDEGRDQAPPPQPHIPPQSTSRRSIRLRSVLMSRSSENRRLLDAFMAVWTGSNRFCLSSLLLQVLHAEPGSQRAPPTGLWLQPAAGPTGVATFSLLLLVYSSSPTPSLCFPSSPSAEGENTHPSLSLSR